MNANAIRLRSGTLDSLRGLTLFSMIAYHLCWDLVYLRGLPWAWYNGFWAYIWQQSICCTFILLSGYCWQMGRHPLRRGLMSFCGGILVSLATALVTPEEPIRFVNCTPFVRQYDILSNKWGVLLCQKEYQTNDIRQNSKNW